MNLSRRTSLPSGGALGDDESGSGHGLAVFAVQVGCNHFDSFTVKPCAGKIGQAYFMAADFQIVGRPLCKFGLDLCLKCFLFGLCRLNQLSGLFVLFDENQ